MSYFHALLNLSSSYKQLVLVFDEITSGYDFRLFEAVGHELSELPAKG